MCHYWKLKIDTKKEMTTDEYRIVAPKVAKLGVRFISLSGGEPFLRNDLPELVRILSKYFFVFITSNGMAITRKMARKVSRSGVSAVFLSLDFITPEKHDSQRGLRGVYKQVINSLSILREELYPNQTVGIMTVLSSQNLEDIEDLLLLAKQLKVKIHIHPYSFAKTGEQTFLLQDDIEDIMKRIKRFKAKYGVVVSSYPFLNKFTQYIKTGVANCKAGKHFFNIDPYGNIQRCVEDYPNGVILKNIKIDTVKIIENKLENLEETSCKKCWYSCRGETETVYTQPISRGLDILNHISR